MLTHPFTYLVAHQTLRNGHGLLGRGRCVDEVESLGSIWQSLVTQYGQFLDQHHIELEHVTSCYAFHVDNLNESRYHGIIIFTYLNFAQHGVHLHHFRNGILIGIVLGITRDVDTWSIHLQGSWQSQQDSVNETMRLK